MKAYTKEERHDAYYEFLMKYLYGDALLWMLSYGIYVHAIDDIIDQDIPGNEVREQFMLKTFEFAECIFSNIFYINNLSKLRPLIKMASYTYMNSVLWEHSKEEWKKKVADHLRQQGNNVVLAVVEICSGIDARNRASIELMEISYKTHHLEDGTPI